MYQHPDRGVQWAVVCADQEFKRAIWVGDSNFRVFSIKKIIELVG